MAALEGKNVVVVGAGQGVGKAMIDAARRAGARTLAIARRPEPLAALAGSDSDRLTLAADASDEATPARVVATLSPDVLVVCGGSHPGKGSLQDQTWESFSRNWENDVRSSFNFCKAALSTPYAPGSTVVLVSSGAGLAGSSRSGGYAGAKRMQMFMAEYAQEESDRLELGIRFLSLVPRFIMAETELGKAAIADYARYRGISEQEFTARFAHPQTPADVANAFIALVTEDPPRGGVVFTVDGQGLSEVA